MGVSDHIKGQQLLSFRFDRVWSLLAAEIDFTSSKSVVAYNKGKEYERTRILSNVFAGGLVTVSALVAMTCSLDELESETHSGTSTNFGRVRGPNSYRGHVPG